MKCVKELSSVSASALTSYGSKRVARKTGLMSIGTEHVKSRAMVDSSAVASVFLMAIRVVH